MEAVGTLTLGQSKYLGEMYIYSSVRKPGYVYEFSRQHGNKYRCCSCKKLKKVRCVTIENNAIVAGVKHPEDGHHPDCQPIPDAGNIMSVRLSYYIYTGSFWLDY